MEGSTPWIRPCIIESSKPEIFKFYNKAEASVDVLDQKVRHYSICRNTYCWPLVVFYNILDISAYNAYVLYQMQPPGAGKDGSSRARFKFLCALGEELIKANMQLRARYLKDLNLPTTNTIKALSIHITNQKIQRLDEPPQKACCHFYQKSQDQQTRQQCSECKIHVCKENSKKLVLCYVCAESGQSWMFQRLFRHFLSNQGIFGYYFIFK